MFLELRDGSWIDTNEITELHTLDGNQERMLPYRVKICIKNGRVHVIV